MLALLCLLTACAAPAERHEPSKPAIVSLNPCTDAILAEVTAPGQLLAVSYYSHEPSGTSMPLAEARRYRATGGTVEEVLALDPDVVVTSSYLDPASAQAFRRLGIRVETVGIATSVADSEAQIRQLATLAGERERGEALVSRIDHAVASARRSEPPVSTLLWQEGGLVPGPETLVAQLLESGVRIVVTAGGVHRDQRSRLPSEVPRDGRVGGFVIEFCVEVPARQLQGRGRGRPDPLVEFS